jgi:branched-chain amino acid transport system ATP-binding protein
MAPKKTKKTTRKPVSAKPKRAVPKAKKAATRKRGKNITGYGAGGVDTVISVEEVTRQVQAIAEEVSIQQLDDLVNGEPFLQIDDLRAGYGKMQILHNLNLRVGRKQSLCLIGPNGAGKSTILHAIFGFNDIFDGQITVGGANGDKGDKRDITAMSPNQKLKEAGIAYILQDKSVFPSMTVEENLWMGGFLMEKVLSGGERRLLEISRALVMEPEILLVDEPSIGLEPRFIDMVFEILHDLQHGEGKTIVMVEQNAKKGLEYADIGYVLVSGVVAIAGKGDDLLANPEVGRLFLGG